MHEKQKDECAAQEPVAAGRPGPDREWLERTNADLKEAVLSTTTGTQDMQVRTANLGQAVVDSLFYFRVLDSLCAQLILTGFTVRSRRTLNRTVGFD